ncbi:hypothetical protein BRYFOR_06011 [Marvinbryantia formatexigens DSM 14469]|uniref:DUF5717 domain-containing protein n=1 Tax=Marvinbryantia formatexigens DSM 14469 TaxID=478749 RepID=C6LBL6_9FIRM|nr:DUF5717 family protein [Marvinbryantia formatexigens]EET61819.1 hypothetical protein BRYFOR_06011 [Marvinbryantia formatexigens DSM 14469]UWO25814.1 DUF5717 family protein [Marvinbryantia formatexigens DSM 14469]SDF38345.1 hypothetical protein SAMN05660368_00622 [Marvinbryantia formatexigens]
MKKRIGELLKEKFEYAPEKLQLSTQKLEGAIAADRVFHGKFSVEAGGGGQAQGFVYSTNARVTISPEVFIGRKETFRFQADPAGLKDGEMLEGAFVICADSGEYTLPYCLQAAKPQHRKTEPLQMTPEAFAQLAKGDFGRAYVLFASTQFVQTVRGWGTRALTLYEGLQGTAASYRSLEQFLVGMGLKEPVTVSLASEHLSMKNPGDNEREELLLLKNTWGFAPLSFSCDAPFLTIERPEITTDEFVGSSYHIGFVIHREHLHAGRNFARITVNTECRTQSCVVEILNTPHPASERRGLRRRQEILQLLHAYIDYRAGRNGVREWSGISLSCLDNLHRAGGENLFYDLYRVYILFTAGDSVEAQIRLGELAEQNTGRYPAQWKGFYLYLTTFENKEKEHLEYVQQEIQELFLANQENWVLQWLMLKVNDSLFRSDSERLDALRRQYLCGCHSPVMYLEAWELLKKEPLLLRGLEAFEIHVLAFLCKEKLLDREICGQAAQIAMRHATAWNPLLCGVLCRCYDAYPGKNLLTAICSLLMKGHKDSPRYSRWFARGVEQDIRLAGLYEYYARSAQDLNVRELPQAVRMYFSYNNTLESGKKAALYANIIRNREKDAQTFETYRQTMELFMEEQLLEGRMSEDLALIYETLLTPYVLTEKLADGLSRALFTYEITCENPHIRHVIAIHRQLRGEQRVQLVQGKACVQIYSPDCCLLLEDRDGARIADLSFAAHRRLLAVPALEEYCRGQVPLPEGMLLHDCCSLMEEAPVSEGDTGRLVRFMELPQLGDESRRSVQEKLLLYYSGHPRDAYLTEYLERADFEELSGEHMQELVELLVSEGMGERAYALVQKYGPEHVASHTLVRLCSRRIAETEQREDAFLLALCARCFFDGVYDEPVLRYLLSYYEGPAKSMKALWQAGQGFLMEDYSLEEKILVTVLYTRQDMEQTEPVFVSYCRKAGNTRICRAYVIWMSYCYFVREMPVEKSVFTYIEQHIIGEIDAPQICQLALLRYYTLAEKLGAGQQKWLQYLLEKYTEKGMYFRFYQKLPERLLRHLNLHDKFLVEYRTDPENRVTLHYRLNGGKEQTLLLQDIYEGIFVYAFTLFYGDKLEWHLEIEGRGKTEQTQPQKIVCSRRSHRGQMGRYELTNRMAEAVSRQDKKQLKEIREQYVGQQYLVDELFGIN